MYILACPHKALLSFPHFDDRGYFAPQCLHPLSSIKTTPFRLVLMTAADKTGRVMQKFKCVCPNRRKIIVLDYQDAASRIAAELRGVPDLIIGNYSDGNLVASLLSYKIGVTQIE
ncbi:hypothetical protein L2E82_04378 [Cichorium intybus]|uniref:Uncharacterized protein n=1 Tax=Cichorium intybus TaxID=13427 RepID=A0ACB9H7J4_CICIN|nr:hypothetical protein L2E82_04378 [Cichorium intybus]